MTLRSFLPTLLALTLLAAGASAAPLPAPPPLPMQCKSPLLYVRFVGPPGLQVTFFQGLTAPRTHNAPATVGLRPGYLYRVKLSGWPQGLDLYPTLEVRGT